MHNLLSECASRLSGSLAIGPASVANRVLLAPMSGVTDAAFRRQVCQLGGGAAVSEMTASAELAGGDPAAQLRIEGSGLRIVQLAGCEAKWLAEGARIAEAGGAQIIDINMGCPARRVINGMAGSALMRDLDHALRLIEATVAAVAVPVTLKMRLGWDERSINAPELAARAEAAGVRMISVHGRTRCQFYKGVADWTAIRAVKRAVKVPVVANGDIRGCDDAALALDRSGADAVMIGRAAMGRPWLPGHVACFLRDGARLPAPGLEVQKTLLLELYDDTLRLYGRSVGLRHVRKHLRAAIETAFGDGNPRDAFVAQKRAKILTGEEPAEVAASITELYQAAEERRAA